MGKCQPNVMEGLKTDPKWNQVVANADHLELMQLIRATVMSQTGYQYPFLKIQRQKIEFEMSSSSHSDNICVCVEVQHKGRRLQGNGNKIPTHQLDRICRKGCP